MNIDDFKNAVIASQIATLKEQIKMWEIYGTKSNTSVTEIISALNLAITDLQAL